MASDPSEMPSDHDVDAERERHIRERAYQLWQEDGAQEGKADDYWHRAQELLEREASTKVSRQQQAPTRE